MTRQAYTFLFFTMICLLVSSENFPAAAQPASVEFVADYPKRGGSIVEITKAAFQRVGYQVSIQFQPWMRALKTTMDGRAEALIGVLYTEKRGAKMYYSDLVYQSEMLFFKLKATRIDYTHLSDLKGLVVGVILGGFLTPELIRADDIRKEPANSYQINIRKLLARRIDLFTGQKKAVLEILHEEFKADAGKIDYLPQPFTVMKFYNCFSKAAAGSAQKLADFNRGLRLIVEDGTYDAILDKGLHE